MIKQLKLFNDNEKFYVQRVDDEAKKIAISNKTINGEELYNSFYKDEQFPLKYEIINELNPDNKIIYNQIKVLFEKIDNQIELTFNQTTNE